MSDALRLCARTDADLTLVAAHLQDAIVAVADVAYLSQDRQFLLVANRFRWERAIRAANGNGAATSQPLYERVFAGVRFDGVEAVQTRGVDLRQRGRMLELLTIRRQDDHIVMEFAGGAAIRLRVASLQCAVLDLCEPWPTRSCPCHDRADGASAA